MNAQLVLLYLGLLKQDNYKEQVDSTSLYKLLGLESNATSQEVEARYKLLKGKINPEAYPGFSVNKERFEYLISRIDRGYSEYISGKSNLDDVVETFEYTPISDADNVFRPDPYVPYKEQPSFPFISEMQPEEFKPDPYIPYREQKHHDFISEGPSKDVSRTPVQIFSSDEPFKAGDAINPKHLLIPIEEVDELSLQILDAVISKILAKVPIKGEEMLEAISTVLKNYPEKQFESRKK